jgi:HTH-type transcriptional regulator / antitoxin HigA
MDQQEAERLWGAKAGTPEGDRLDVLATLIDPHETEHYPMDPPDPIEAIKFRMDLQGLRRRDLKEIIGTRTRIAEVLKRKRGVSIAMIRRLHERLGISAENVDPTEPKKGGVRRATPTRGSHPTRRGTVAFDANSAFRSGAEGPASAAG